MAPAKPALESVVLEVGMDTKTLLEWSAKYHTPNYGRTPLVLVRGEGTRVWDSDGKEYLDFTSGIAVTSLGHCHPVVTGAIREAAATLLHVSNIFNNAPQVHLAKLLVEHSFADRVFFCNSGAEANEAAFKVVRKYAKERLADDRVEIIATHNSFHGRTLATVTATGQPKYQHGFEPLMPGFKHVPYNDLRAMERAIDSHTAAILVEPIQGEGGVNVPDDDYLPGLRKLCDESGALLMFDEIQTGVGRTGKLWGYEHAGGTRARCMSRARFARAERRREGRAAGAAADRGVGGYPPGRRDLDDGACQGQRVRHLVSAGDLTREQVLAVFELAADLKQRW